MIYVKQYFYIIGSILFTGYLLVISKSLFNPLLAALIIAFALRPFAIKLEHFRIPRLGSTLFSVLLFIFIFLGLALLFSFQLKNVDFEIQSFKVTSVGFPEKIQGWLTDFLGISAAQQTSLFREATNGVLKSSLLFVNNTLSATTNFLTSFVIFILSLFFLLYYRTFYVTFLYKTVNLKHHLKLTSILNKIQEVVINYILGLSLIIIIVATLNTIGLFFIGIDHAILFGLMAAVLTLIPYIGILLGALLPAIFALLTKDSLWYSFSVIAVFMFVQFIEGNFLTPNIVGRQVSINPFAAILGLIIGGMLLGLTGIIFALPVLAILKVISDNILILKPLGKLIGKP
jgi:predicted PurR-regulated permease PerM